MRYERNKYQINIVNSYRGWRLYFYRRLRLAKLQTSTLWQNTTLGSVNLFPLFRRRWGAHLYIYISLLLLQQHCSRVTTIHPVKYYSFLSTLHEKPSWAIHVLLLLLFSNKHTTTRRMFEFNRQLHVHYGAGYNIMRVYICPKAIRLVVIRLVSCDGIILLCKDNVLYYMDEKSKGEPHALWMPVPIFRNRNKNTYCRLYTYIDNNNLCKFVRTMYCSAHGVWKIHIVQPYRFGTLGDL